MKIMLNNFSFGFVVVVSFREEIEFTKKLYRPFASRRL